MIKIRKSIFTHMALLFAPAFAFADDAPTEFPEKLARQKWPEFSLNYIEHDAPILLKSSDLECDRTGQFEAAFVILNNFCGDGIKARGVQDFDKNYPGLRDTLSSEQRAFLVNCASIYSGNYQLFHNREDVHPRVRMNRRSRRGSAPRWLETDTIQDQLPVVWPTSGSPRDHIFVIGVSREDVQKTMAAILDRSHNFRSEIYAKEFDAAEDARTNYVALLERREALPTELEAARNELAEFSKKVNPDYRMHYADIIKQNRLQLPNIEIDLIGLQAKLTRIKEGIELRNGSANSEAFQVLMSMQTKLDIELAGLLARRDAINQMNGRLAKYASLQDKVGSLKFDIGDLPAKIETAKEELKRLRNRITNPAACATPLPEKIDVHILKLNVIEG